MRSKIFIGVNMLILFAAQGHATILTGNNAGKPAQYAPALYRLADHRSYRILDTAGLCLYRINKLVQGEKIARPEDVYYFSVRPNSPVMELTRVNLEKAFAGNDRFRYELESLFHTDRELIAYDNLSGIYKIQYVYRKSL